MRPWELIDSAPVPGSRGDLCLYRRGQEFVIRVDGQDLMTSHVHGSEEALATIACARIAGRQRPRVLIGGLGMGYTLAAALRRLAADAEIVVAELAPAVVEWNRGPLAHLAGGPLQDGRVTLFEGDVARVLKAESQRFDAILMDVDNGPEGLTRRENDWLYSHAGLSVTFAALRPAAVLAVWSATPDRGFLHRLRVTGFKVDDLRFPERGSRGGPNCTIWIACRSS